MVGGEDDSTSTEIHLYLHMGSDSATHSKQAKCERKEANLILLLEG